MFGPNAESAGGESRFGASQTPSSQQHGTERAELPPVESRELPVIKHIPLVLRSLAASDVAILISPTGSGKSTQLSKPLVAAGYQVYHMLPTRIAATVLHSYIAPQIFEATGKTAGLQTGVCQDKQSDDSLLVCTDGVMLSKVLAEGYFQNFNSSNAKDVFILDEAHLMTERMAAFLMLYREAWRQGRVPKLLILSATINPAEFTDYLYEGIEVEKRPEIPVINIEGRVHEITQLTPNSQSLAVVVSDLIEEEKGGVIVFTADRGEIRRQSRNIATELNKRGIEVDIRALHGKQSKDEQAAAIRDIGPKTVVVATNVAETSVTIRGLKTVVKLGVERVPRIHGEETRLMLEPISISSSEQQGGRVGRTEPGFVVDLTPEPLKNRPPRYWPIQHVKLDGILLQLIVAGYDPLSHKFPNDPGEERKIESIERLNRLGFIDREYTATELGRFATGFPLDPRDTLILSKALTFANRRGGKSLLQAAVTVAAMVSVGELRDPTAKEDLTEIVSSDYRPMMRQSDKIAGLYAVETLFKEQDLGRRKELIEYYGINQQALDQIESSRAELASRLNIELRPIGQINFGAFDSQQFLEVCTANWIDQVYSFISTDRSGHGLYGLVGDHRSPLRQLSRGSTLPVPNGREHNYPLFITGEPFALGLDVYDPNKLLLLVSQSSVVPRSWIEQNGALVKKSRDMQVRNRRQERVGRRR